MSAPKTIAGILLVPAEGSDLLAGGECGARPPTVYCELAQIENPTPQDLARPVVFSDWDYHWKPNYGTMDIDEGDALPLAWGGKVLPIGCFWAWPTETHRETAVWGALHGSTYWTAALHRWAAAEGHTLLLVDSDGRTIDTDGDGDTPGREP